MFYQGKLKNVDFDPEILKLKTKFKSIEANLYWKSYIEDNYDLSQYINKQFLNSSSATNKENQNTFNKKNYRSFVEARDFLSAIPQGKLILTPELIKQTHKKSASFLKQDFNLFQKVFKKYFVEPGEYKQRNNRGDDPLKNPLTEEQYINLKNNPYARFIELPWPLSRIDKRRGYILYGEKNNVEKDMQDLCDWVNSNMGKMDPIRLASEFQWRYVSIHPMVDGNGRTSLLLANRILLENDLPPIMLNFNGFDMYYSPEKYAQVIRESILEFYEFLKDDDFKEHLKKETPNLFQVNFTDGPRLGLLPLSARTNAKREVLNKANLKLNNHWSKIKSELFANFENEEIIIGNQRFIAMRDGFFYNKHGIPYAIFEDGLYPIPESTAYLYSLGGKVKETRFFNRQMSPFLRDHYRRFFKFLGKYEKDSAVGNNVKVYDYELIKKANDQGEIFLYDWQNQLLESVFEIKDSDPYAVLAQTRGYNTAYEKAFHFGDKIGIAEVLAQYILMDLKYSKYSFYVDSLNNSNNQNYKNIILNSREKLFNAAKKILSDKVDQLNTAIVNSPEKFESQSEWKLFLEYYQQSPLKYANFKDYLDSKDQNKVVLIRADQGGRGLTGFYSNNFLNENLKKIPGYDIFKNYVNNLVMSINNKTVTVVEAEKKNNDILYNLLKNKIKGVDKLLGNLNKVLQKSPYDSRGLNDEFDRMYLEHYLHSVNDPFKKNISFSTNTSIYIRSSAVDSETGEVSEARIPFSFDSQDAKVFFVRLDKSEVQINEASNYFRQYEVLKENQVSPTKIVKSFDMSFFNDSRFDKVESAADKETQKLNALYESSLTKVETKKESN